MTYQRLVAGSGAVLLPFLLAAVGACDSADAQGASNANTCSLSEGEYDARMRTIRGVLARHRGELARLEFQISLRGDSTELRRQVEALADAERECCEFMEIRFAATATGGTVHVAVPGAAASVVRPMLDALLET